MQNLTDEEKDEMPSCNLSETVHNIWLQMSGNRGISLYTATVDDYVRGFMQCTNYSAYLRGENPGKGPSKAELRLRRAQKSGIPKRIADATEHFDVAPQMLSRQPHREGEEVFGSTKRKLDQPIGSEYDSHRPDKVNFSQPRVATRKTRARVEAGPVPVDAASSPVRSPDENTTRPHVTAVEETDVDDSKWHLVRLPKGCAKACFAQQAKTNKKCKARLVRGGKTTVVPCYWGTFTEVRKDRQKWMQFCFCNDDIQRCVMGTKRNWVSSMAPPPLIWPVKRGTRLTKREILDLEAAGFRLPQRQELPSQRVFHDGDGSIPQRPRFELSHLVVPDAPGVYPTVRGGFKIRRCNRVPRTEHENNWASSLLLTVHIQSVTMIPTPGFGCIISLVSETVSESNLYKITVGPEPGCTCPNFKEMSVKSLGKRPPWVPCKHLYYIYNAICNLEMHRDSYIHAPTLSFNEVKTILESGLLELVTF